jgi:hypothetical protein
MIKLATSNGNHMDKKQIDAYVKQIADALTEEAMDYIVENGNEDLISDEGLAKLFSKKFISFEDYPRGWFGMSLEYDDINSEMGLFSSWGHCIWSVKCDVKDPQSIIGCAIECLNNSPKEFDVEFDKYKNKDENKSQKVFDRLFKALDKEYQKFLKRKAKKNEEIEDPEEDGNWTTFYEKAEEMGKDAVIEMGVKEDQAEMMFEEFWDDANSARDDARIDKNYQALVKKFTKHYNKVIAETVNAICRIRLQMSDKYVYEMK